jgi:hypothetical protein
MKENNQSFDLSLQTLFSTKFLCAAAAAAAAAARPTADVFETKKMRCH